MSRNKWIAYAAVILAAAFAVYVLYFGNSDEKAVRKRFQAIMEAVEKPQGEGNIAMAAKFQSLSRMLADTVTVQCTNPTVSLTASSDVILSNYSALRRFTTSISLSARDIDITFPEPDKALLTCFGTAKASLTSGDSVNESRPALLTFIRKDGKWLLESASERTVFKRQ